MNVWPVRPSFVVRRPNIPAPNTKLSEVWARKAIHAPQVDLKSARAVIVLLLLFRLRRYSSRLRLPADRRCANKFVWALNISALIVMIGAEDVALDLICVTASTILRMTMTNKWRQIRSVFIVWFAFPLFVNISVGGVRRANTLFLNIFRTSLIGIPSCR